jgi:uncharacterized protein YqgV (UPF0045/DUF77 family)
MFLAAQMSLYPLRQAHLSPAISSAASILREHGLEVSSGPMSSLVSGDDEALFAAIKDIFRKSSDQGDMMMVVTISNACPVSQ